MALYHHLRSQHPSQKPYSCWDCEHCFNNLCELSSHKSNHVRSVACKHCSYRVTTKAKMYQHVWTHTSGVKYTICGKGFATITEMLYHQHLHDERELFPCDECELVYHMRAALIVHQRGKHGPGFPCENCRIVFHIPIQHNHHQKHCL